MNKLQTKQLAFLEETANFYKLSNRALDDTAGCIYSTTDMSDGCAIGRHIKDKKLCAELDKLQQGAVVMSEAFNLLPKELKEYGQIFLAKVQRLHDIEDNWNEIGLSDQGFKEYEKIKKFIEENIEI